jgi:hypothetical protein
MTSQRDDLLQQVSAYYSRKVREFGATPRGADWKDQTGQDIRFAQLARITRGARTGSLAELGCGWGAFAGWAAAHGFDFDYTGYDVSDDMLAAARGRFADTPRVAFRSGAEPREPADFVIASGVFNVRFDIPDATWLAYVERTIDAMAASARKGFAFNCLTGFADADRKEARLFYPYPGEMFDRCLRRHGRHGALLQDYGLYEFTILIWKGLEQAETDGPSGSPSGAAGM